MGRFSIMCLAWMTVGLMIGCRSAHRARDPEFARISSAIQASWHAPPSNAELVSPVLEQLAGPRPVEAYVEFALAQNPGIQAARQRVEVAALRVPQAASLKDPMVDVTSWPFFPNTPQTASGRMTVDVMVSQELPWFGKLATQAAAAEEAANAARAQLAAAELQVVERVKLAYYDLYLVEQSIRLVEQDRRLLADMAEVAEAQYRVGRSGQQEVLRLQAELGQVDSDLIRMRQMRSAAQAELAEVLHISPETPLATLTDLPAEHLPADLILLYEQALAARPELHAVLAEIERDRFMVEMAHLEYRPDITVKFGWGDMTTNRAIAPTADGIDNVAAGLNLNLPIYRKRLDAAVREAEAQVLASAREYDQLKDETQREIKKLFTEAVSQRDMAELFGSSIIPKTEQALQLSIRDYQVGRAEFGDMLENWRELLRFHLMHLQQQTQLRKSLASLERVVGGYLQHAATADRAVVPSVVPPMMPPDSNS